MATITGSGSKWINGSSLYVGRSGNGALRVEAGGQVSSNAGFLGDYLSMGTATITGAGSQWANSSDLYVGSLGHGTLTLTAGGLVSVRRRLTIDLNGRGESFNNLASGGMLALWGGRRRLALAPARAGRRDASDSVLERSPRRLDAAHCRYARRRLHFAVSEHRCVSGYTLLTVLAPGPPATLTATAASTAPICWLGNAGTRDVVLGEGAKYAWEIASVDGAPGEAWDVLQVEGNLHFTATNAAPWTVGLNDLPGFQPGQAQPWLIASANSITGFDADAVRFDISGISDVWPSLTPNQLVLYAQDNDLFLKVVPEPPASILTITGIIAAAILRCRKD